MSNNVKGIEYLDGSIRYYGNNGVYHREDGPAIEYSDGVKFWYKNGVYHREDGPAKWYSENHYAWYYEGELHRLDGPAVVYSNGSSYWYKNGKRHNPHGPAIVEMTLHGTFRKEWYYEGTYYKDEAAFNKSTPSIEELSKMFKEVCNE
jgi:hypothetical protein